MIWVLTVIYFLARLPFIRNYPVYYDSFEYVRIASALNWQNFSQQIASLHQPIHTFYFVTILIFKTIFPFLTTETVLALISLIFGYLTMVVWYRLIEDFTFCLGRQDLFRKPQARSIHPSSLGVYGARDASGSYSKALAPRKNWLPAKLFDPFFGCILLMVFPYFFVANTNILYEGELLFWEISALYFFVKWLKYRKNIWVFISALFYGLSLSIMIEALAILPIFILVYGQFNYSRLKKLLYKNFIRPIIRFIFSCQDLFRYHPNSFHSPSVPRAHGTRDTGGLAQKPWFLIKFIGLSLIITLLTEFLAIKNVNKIFEKYNLPVYNFAQSGGGGVIFAGRFLRNIVLESFNIFSVSGGVVFLGLLFYLTLSVLSGLVILLRSPRSFSLSPKLAPLTRSSLGVHGAREAVGSLKSLGSPQNSLKNIFSLCLFFLTWILPSLILMQYWQPWLYGRFALFIIFPAILVILSVFRKSWMRLAIVAIISITTSFYAYKQMEKPPEYKLVNLVNKIKGEDKIAIVTSDYNRFLYEEKYKTLGLNGIKSDREIEIFIDSNLGEGRKVYIDSTALRFPYWQYDGSFYLGISTGRIEPRQMDRVLGKYSLELLTKDKSERDIYIKEILGKKVSSSHEIFFGDAKRPTSLNESLPPKQNSDSRLNIRQTFITPQKTHALRTYYISPTQAYKYDPAANIFYFILAKKDPIFTP